MSTYKRIAKLDETGRGRVSIDGQEYETVRFKDETGIEGEEVLRPEIRTRWTVIDAEFSADFHAKGKNVRPHKARAVKYARDIKSGRWDDAHQGLSIGIDGSGLDGFGRTAGVAEAGGGRFIVLPVTFGLQKGAAGVDTGQRARLTHVAAGVAGHEMAREVSGTVSRMIAGIKPVGGEATALTVGEIVAYHKANYADIDPIIAIVKASTKEMKKLLNNGVVLGIVSRVHGSVPEAKKAVVRSCFEKLSDLNRAVAEGRLEPRDSVLGVLKDALVNKRVTITKVGPDGKSREVAGTRITDHGVAPEWAKTLEYALDAYLKGKVITKFEQLKRTEVELFPLPGDEKRG